MDIDIFKASNYLSKLDLKMNTDHMEIEVLWFRVMRNTGEWCISRHRHSSFEFHFVAAGGCKVLLDEGEFNVNEGEFYITAPGIHHTQFSNENKEYVEYSINCEIKLTDESLNEEKQILDVLYSVKCVPYKNINHILNLFEVVLKEVYFQKIGFYNKIKNLVQMILIETVRVINKNTELSYEVPMKYKKYDYRFMQIERYIIDNLNTPILIKDIARYMHLSDKQICRIIQQRKGISTKEFICRLKFEKAKELLKNTQLSIGEISEMLGFSSQYYFHNFFKKREGYSPSIFRSNVQYVQKP